MRKRFSERDWERMTKLHALPDGWNRMQYPEFLVQRRKLMAEIIREALGRIE
jgi:hypothetical protein